MAPFESVIILVPQATGTEDESRAGKHGFDSELQYQHQMDLPIKLPIYYWDHATRDGREGKDTERCRNVSLEVSGSNNWTPKQVADWTSAFENEMKLVYESDVVSRIHLVVRKGIGIAKGAQDDIVAHALLVLVTDDFVKHAKSRDRSTSRTSLYGYKQDYDKNPILRRKEVNEAQASDGSTLWCSYLHTLRGEDSVAIRHQLESAVYAEIRRLHLKQILIEATRSKVDIWHFGLLPCLSGTYLPDININNVEGAKALLGVLQTQDRTLFGMTAKIAADLKIHRPVKALFSYKPPSVQLKKKEKKALSLWYRYGRDKTCVFEVAGNRTGMGAPNTFDANYLAGRRKLGYDVDGKEYSLEKLFEAHPEVLGPYPGE